MRILLWKLTICFDFSFQPRWSLTIGFIGVSINGSFIWFFLDISFRELDILPITKPIIIHIRIKSHLFRLKNILIDIAPPQMIKTKMRSSICGFSSTSLLDLIVEPIEKPTRVRINNAKNEINSLRYSNNFKFLFENKQKLPQDKEKVDWFLPLLQL